MGGYHGEAGFADSHISAASWIKKKLDGFSDPLSAVYSKKVETDSKIFYTAYHTRDRHL